MGFLSLSNLAIYVKKAQFSRLKSEFKGQILSKFDLGLLNTYKLMYFNKNKEEKILDCRVL